MSERSRVPVFFPRPDICGSIDCAKSKKTKDQAFERFSPGKNHVDFLTSDIFQDLAEKFVQNFSYLLLMCNRKCIFLNFSVLSVFFFVLSLVDLWTRTKIRQQLSTKT